MTEIEEVILQHDELEAIRLKDLLGTPQEEAAKQMNVSQPTFHRLLLSAHEKIAHAIINGKALRIEGGNVNINETFIPPCGWRHICKHGWKEKTVFDKENIRSKKQGGTMKIAISKLYNARRLCTDFFIDCNSNELQWISALLQGASTTITPVDIISRMIDTNDTLACSW